MVLPLPDCGLILDFTEKARCIQGNIDAVFTTAAIALCIAGVVFGVWFLSKRNTIKEVEKE